MICRNCGSEMPDGTLFCGNCGQELEVYSEPEQIEPEQTEPEQTEPEQTEDVFCTNCGEKIENGSSFCSKCGSATGDSQTDDEAFVFCFNCGAKMPEGTVICTNCGANADTYEVSEPVEKTVEPIAMEETKKAQKSKKLVPVIIVLSVIIIALLAAIAGYLVWQGGSGGNSTASPEPTVSASPSPSPDATAMPDTTAKKYDTYYVVNCNDSISLRESPSYSASVVTEIPLGSPVSYVESLQNGFAKVVYNGVTGYALQSYLSSNSADIKNPANTQTSSSVVSNPNYTLYRDSDFNFVCAYPSHFRVYNDSDPFVRYSVEAPDKTATVKICATKNKANLSVKTVMDNFKSSYPGTVDYENSGSTWCAVSTYKNGQCHYCYFHVDSNSIKGFELHHDRNYCSVYDKYIDYIYDSIKFN